MRFGVFYELQLPKPWDEDAERRLIQEAIEQVQVADRLGIDYAWAVEHHFLEEYSHCSASEVFLTALAAKTENIRVGFGIRQVIPNYNHPSRTAEAVGMLDLISNGRVDFGIGEGATRLELHGYDIPARHKRDLSLEAAEQVANMMVMEPYPGYEGQGFSMPCRNVIPKPMQKPHPPMWLACTNRKTIEIAARNGLGALSFSFVDPEDAKSWADTYYDIIRSEECVPLGHSVNANIAMVAGFSIHEDAEEARRRGTEGLEFFRYAINALVANDTIPAAPGCGRNTRNSRGRTCPPLPPPPSAPRPTTPRCCGACAIRASTRPSSSSRAAATATTTSARAWSCSGPRCCPSSSKVGRSARRPRPRSWPPTSPPPWSGSSTSSP